MNGGESERGESGSGRGSWSLVGGDKPEVMYYTMAGMSGVDMAGLMQGSVTDATNVTRRLSTGVIES